MRARKKPIEVEVWQWTGQPKADRPDWVSAAKVYLTHDWVLVVPTLEGEMFADLGDWIIRGVEGEVYPCKPQIFEKTYDVIKLA